MPKKLILNADDYGRCAEVNDAVEELIAAGRLRDVSVLMNGQSLDSAVAFLQSNVNVSTGIHLNVVEGKPIAAGVSLLTDSNREFIGLKQLMLRWVLHPLAVSRVVEIEWRAQIKMLVAAGLRISHADSHQHLHAFPPAWRIAVKLCREFGIPSIRLPREKSRLLKRRAGALALNSSLALSRLISEGKGLGCNDYLLGFKRAGAYELATLIDDLRAIPAGLVEIALHPSTADKIPYAGLFGNRERLALLDQTLPQRLVDLGIELTTWKAVTV